MPLPFARRRRRMPINAVMNLLLGGEGDLQGVKNMTRRKRQYIHQCNARAANGGRCQRESTVGIRFCSSHEPKAYFVSFNVKPYEKVPGGGFRSYYHSKPFDTPDDAWEWLDANSDFIWKRKMRPGQRVVSVTVQRISLKRAGVSPELINATR